MEKKSFRDFRSYLFVPLSDERILYARSYERAAREADCLILDLEDSLKTELKTHGRKLIPKAMERLGAVNPSIIVRINNANEDWARDVDACIHPLLRGILLPKTESSEQLSRIAEYLGKMGKRIPVIPLIETPLGVLNAPSIVQSDLPCVFFGCEDLATGLGLLDPMPLNMLYAAQHVVFHCRSRGIPVVGTVGPFSLIHADLKDEFRNILRVSRDVGFSGTYAVDPKQLKWIRSVFEFEEEVERISEIVAAAPEEKAVFTFQGRMYGPPMLKRYRNILDRLNRFKKK